MRINIIQCDRPKTIFFSMLKIPFWNSSWQKKKNNRIFLSETGKKKNKKRGSVVCMCVLFFFLALGCWTVTKKKGCRRHEYTSLASRRSFFFLGLPPTPRGVRVSAIPAGYRLVFCSTHAHTHAHHCIILGMLGTRVYQLPPTSITSRL